VGGAQHAAAVRELARELHADEAHDVRDEEQVPHEARVEALVADRFEAGLDGSAGQTHPLDRVPISSVPGVCRVRLFAIQPGQVGGAAALLCWRWLRDGCLAAGARGDGNETL